MALQGSGQISLAQIASEYGGSTPHHLSEYHSKGNAPSSGEIQIAADFYGTSNFTSPTATGGSISTVGNYKYHRFTGSGTFSVSNIGTVSQFDVLIVAGGGSGGSGYGSGGGAGGLLEYTGQTLSTGSRSVTIGAGGSTSCNYFDPGSTGSSSWVAGFSTVDGGGGGGCEGQAGKTGGSGGGAGGGFGYGSGTSGQGNRGGSYTGGSANSYGSAGGGGAGAIGGPGGSGGNGPGGSGNGGVGLYKSNFSSWGQSGYYAGGGGGGRPPANGGYGTGGTGGTGGGATGTSAPSNCNQANANGTANTGGGGGGKGKERGGDQSGGSGIVIFRYQYQA